MSRKRSHKNPIFRFLFRLVTNWVFNFFITIIIVLNTLSLAADSFDQSIKKEEFLKTCNVLFTWIFAFEMILKLIGLGPRWYAKDFYNCFDCAVVMVSIIDFSVDLALGNNIGPAAGAMKAFRALRLLRIVKILRRWTALQIILKKTAMSMEGIANFSVLMILFMYIFSLLGMQLFAKKAY